MKTYEDLKRKYRDLNEDFYENEKSYDFVFWQNLYFDVDDITSDAIELIEKMQAEIKARDTAIEVLRGQADRVAELNEALRNELNESEEAYNELYDYVEELENEIHMLNELD